MKMLSEMLDLNLCSAVSVAVLWHICLVHKLAACTFTEDHFHNLQAYYGQYFPNGVSMPGMEEVVLKEFISAAGMDNTAVMYKSQVIIVLLTTTACATCPTQHSIQESVLHSHVDVISVATCHLCGVILSGLESSLLLVDFLGQQHINHTGYR